MRTSERGLALIRDFEQVRPRAYRCPAGVLTIGYGHTVGVKLGMEVSREGAERLLLEDVERVEAGLASIVTVPTTQAQWDALVSLCFNLKGGPRWLVGKKLLAKLNAGDYEGAASEFLDINRAGGKVLAGLTRRRRAEVDLFLSPSSDACAAGPEEMKCESV
jgi:lysozyme